MAPDIGSGFGLWCYRQVPGFAAAARSGYRFVASHRSLASALTTGALGKRRGCCLPAHLLTTARTWFLRLLGLIYLIAFWSFWSQVDGLIGHDGILPVAPWLDELRNRFGTEAYRLFPTLCWFNAGDSFLHLLCGSRSRSESAAHSADRAPLLSDSVVGPLSFAQRGGPGLYELSSGITCFWKWAFSAFSWRHSELFPSRRYQSPISPWAHFLLRWLLFRLMFMSGVVKLTSGDDSWWNLTALHYHYETQPLPTPLSWWANQFPPWFQAFSTIVMFGIELGAPFLLFAPRRLRLIGVLGLLTLQVLIALTGNYCFFNLLTAALCLLAVDDAVWPRIGRRAPVRKSAALAGLPGSWFRWWLSSWY